jgi:O-acetylhomoserine (thiol)-lyase
MTEGKYGFETLAIHAGASPDPTTGARATPIYQTTSYVFDDVDHAASLFNLQKFGNIYSRLTNPTVSVLEERVAALEGGTAACATASGHSAQFLTFLNLMGPGDQIVASSKLYGGSISQMRQTFPQFDWRVAYADPRDPENFTRAMTDRTKAVFVESASNPDGIVADLEAIAAIAHAHGVPLVVDNTLPTPYLCQPLRWGADIVVHSMTKYMGGQGTSIGGVIVEGGRFDWDNGKFPALTEPCEAYHGLRFHETFGNFALTVRNKAVGLRDMGPCLSPFNAFLILQGIETLPLRMDRHVANADKVAAWLADHPQVAWVSYARLPQNRTALGREVLSPGPRLRLHLRREGRLRDGRQGRRQLPARLPRRQHRRHPHAHHPPLLDHPPPAQPGAAGRGRRRPGRGPPLGRARDGRRHHRGPRPGPEEGGVIRIQRAARATPR